MSEKSSIVFVGAFSEEDCAKGKDKKAVAKAQKKTGLKYVMSKYMLKRRHIWVCETYEDTLSL